MSDLQERLDIAESKNRLNNWVAIAVALVSVFMAICKVKDDNICQAMLQTKSDAVDTWNEYQAKKIKLHMAELGLNQVEALGILAPEKGADMIGSQKKKYQETITEYKSEADTIMKKAKDFEKQYDDLNYRDDQFDLSDAGLSISLAMLAITSLTGQRRLFYFSCVFIGFGVFMGTAGLLGLKIHPDFLTKMLS
jgi:hypothetical protein